MIRWLYRHPDLHPSFRCWEFFGGFVIVSRGEMANLLSLGRLHVGWGHAEPTHAGHYELIELGGCSWAAFREIPFGWALSICWMQGSPS